MNGILDFSIDTPDNLLQLDVALSELFAADVVLYDNIKYNVAEVKASPVWGLFNEDIYLLRERWTPTSDESVRYFYVDNDVTVTGNGKTTSEDGFTVKANNLNLKLRAGWNAIYEKDTYTKTSVNVTHTVGDLPSIRWVLCDQVDDNEL